MTIKQQGGIFGRNPTFNDVDVDGTLTASDANISGTLTSDGLAVDTDTLYVNAAANRVGINTVTPSSELHIETTGTTGLRLIGGPVGVTTLYMGDTDNNLEGYLQYSNTADYMRIATAGAERFRIHSDGDVELKTGNLIVPSGNGIDFSATSGTGTSELFDDYEEGTWTPAFSVGSTGTATANYTKIGNMVTVTCKFVFATVGVGAQNITWASLPFTPSLGRINGTCQILDAGTAWYSGVTIGDSTSDIQFTTTGDVRLTNVAPFTLAANDELNFTITYRAD